MACGISLECLGLKLDRRRRDRTLIALGWVGFVVIWFFKLRPAHQYKTMMIATASFSGIIMLAATVGVVLRERKLGRLPAIPDKPKPGEAHDWRFKCSLCRQRSAVVCSYAYHDVLPIVCSCSCVGLVVSACITSIATYGQSSATLIVKGMWCGAALGVVAAFVGTTLLMMCFRRPNPTMRTVGWQVCCAVVIAIFYAGAASGWLSVVGLSIGSLIGNYIKFFTDAQAFAWASVGALFVLCCLLPVVFCKWCVCRSSKVAGFNAEWGPGGKLVSIPQPDHTQDDYVSLFEFPLEQMEPYTIAVIVRGAVEDAGGAVVKHINCSCCGRLKPESQEAKFSKEFDSPINPLFADALAAGRIIAARGVLAQGGQVNGMHEGKNMLMHAIDGGSMECFELLLAERSLDVNRVLPATGSTDDGIAALHYAVQQGKAEFVAKLLSKPSVNYRIATSKHRHTALRMAIEAGHAEILKLFLSLPKPKKSVKPLLEAKSMDGSGVTQVLLKLVRRGPSVLPAVSLVLAQMEALNLEIDKKLMGKAQRLGYVPSTG